MRGAVTVRYTRLHATWLGLTPRVAQIQNPATVT